MPTVHEKHEILIEILCEDLPSRMQKPGLTSFQMFFTQAFEARHITYHQVISGVTPRRFALAFIDLVYSQTEEKTLIERRGPRVGAPDVAVQGFAKSLGASVDQLFVQHTPKGNFYTGKIIHHTETLAQLLQRLFPQSITSISWPKTMRWGVHKTPWARPIQQVTCMLDGASLPVTTPYSDVCATNETYGHRFLSAAPFTSTDFASYEKKLLENKVCLSWDKRRQHILEQATTLAARHNFTLVEDQALLDELAGLVEWPVCYLGQIDQIFMALSSEISMTILKKHQRYLCLKTSNGAFAPAFIIVSNMETADKGRTIIAGNEKVARARLADGLFCYERDLTTSLSSMATDLQGIIFYQNLGTMADKAERLKMLAQRLAPYFDVKPDRAGQAGALAKADLASDIVKELPTLQGVMGGYYAHGQEIKKAITEHYLPKGPTDVLPTTPLGKLISLCDKIDTLVGFFACGQYPTGSKDPYALRRACFGVIRILEEHMSDLSLAMVIKESQSVWSTWFALQTPQNENVMQSLLAFFIERLSVLWKTKYPHLKAALSTQPELNIGALARRLNALASFLDAKGVASVATYRRVANIVAIAQQEGKTIPLHPDVTLFQTTIEKGLMEVLKKIAPSLSRAIQRKQFVEAFDLISPLTIPIETFFDQVVVNCADVLQSSNRLSLLQCIDQTLKTLVDFSLLPKVLF